MSSVSQPVSHSHLLPSVPDFLALHVATPHRYPFLLQSAAQGTAQGRYDILFAYPGQTLCLSGDRRLSGPCADRASGFLDALGLWSASEACATEPDTASPLPFTGGWFLYLAYELAGELEPGLDLPGNPNEPVALATRIPAALVYDHLLDQCFAVAETLSQLEALLSGLHAVPALRAESSDRLARQSSEENPAQFLAAVEQVKTHIAAGDVYQANLSRQWRAPALGQKAWQLYQHLCRANPAPFAGFADFNAVPDINIDYAIVSSSPERLVAVRNGSAETRPIAGTRPRHTAQPISEAELADFLGNPKERAEHVMLIDLERNDLGRICKGGSVIVNEFMAVESYPHVHHIVSNVVGTLRDDVGVADVIRAVFPGGTITGCPKVRCMEIIARQEGRTRGAYTGSMGYLNRDGSCDLNILIRTMVLQADEITLSAGSGIVADSDPEAELAETRAKAKGLLVAIE
jgi:anthranilate synthase component 1